MVRILAAFLVAASTDASESISLLQTNAHINKHELHALPDPKKQSSLPTGTSDTTREEDYNCAGGKGKWVRAYGSPYPYHRSDVSRWTWDITHRAEPRMSYEPWLPNGRVQATGQSVEPKDVNSGPKTDHGPVKDEKDCFARVRIDFLCNHYQEDILNAINHGQGHTGLGVWYNPGGPTPNTAPINYGGQNPVCFCGKIDRSDPNNKPANIEIVDASHDGMWYCRLTPADFEGVDENTQIGKSKDSEPKEKKTPEEKEQCKAAKAATKESRDALKALRQERKELKAQLKALRERIKVAREELLKKKGFQDGVC